MIDKFLSFVQKAGELMIQNQSLVDVYSSKFKTEKITDIVTKTDFEVSSLFKEFITDNFSNLDYFIIDEEIVSELKDPISKLKNSEYTFIIDPVDGTLPYASGLPYYALSIGVFKYGKPLYGFLYAPELNQLIYCDDTDVYLVNNPFSSTENKIKIPDLDNGDIAPIFFEHPTGMKLTEYWNKNRKAFPMNMYSGVLHFMYVAMGQGLGYYYCIYLWDIAGSLAIFDKLGIKVLNIKTKSEFDLFTPNTFNEKLRSNNMYIACLPKHFDYLQKIAEITFNAI